MYEGNLISGLVELAVTTTDTVRTPVDCAAPIHANACPDCRASYGHTILCPLLNRNIAEAKSALNGEASDADVIAAHGLGIKL